MILDERTEFADATSMINNAGATYVLGDVIDISNAAAVTDGINDVDELYLVIGIDTDVAASGGAATVQFKLVSDSTAALTSAPTTHWSSDAIAKGTLVAGYQVVELELPKGTYQRYLGVTYTIATNNLTAGKANAFLTPAPTTQRSFPDAI